MALLLLLGALLAQAVTSHATCEKYWTEFDGSCYRLSHGGVIQRGFGSRIQISDPDGQSQLQANQQCGIWKAGASLVTINTVKESDFLFAWVLSSFRDPSATWIGLYKVAFMWKWYSGENVTYVNWEDPQAALEFNEPMGATLFEADPPRYPGQNFIDISPHWKIEEPHTRRSFLCEYKLPINTNATGTGTGTSQGALLRQGYYQQDLAPLNSFAAGTQGMAGSRLHEIVRNQRYRRPSAYRQRNFFAALP
ncbi:30 kDa spicule matrix protein-like [Diadema antillarum]|uniref:30 kDa spicule matrix protein-like n=1 Tax=Diadema antillarum TaxID=105358 RepID=UPI003A848930